MAEDQYTSEQERFAKQLQRDLDRASNKRRQELGQDPRLSQSTINKLIRDDTSQWAREILNQKLSSNNASNIVAQSSRVTTSSTSFIESPDLAPLEKGSTTASSYPIFTQEETEPPDPPQPPNLPSFEAYICVDGQPVLHKIFGEALE